ncbi:MAG: class I SAM-dependent methyltransferase, partial [Alphaproteobacteria bacterium]|nr:class I SAM-dependent methyltransferase [Alphaproteobacteria bacterium]
ALQAQAGIAAALAGEAHLATRRFREAAHLDPATMAMVEGFRYVETHRAGARLFGSAAALLDHALSLVPASGLVLEFGVFRGNSLRQIARRVAPRAAHGFDSFEGLPEDWSREQPKGSYGLGGALPEVEANVALHVGWFEATVPDFARRDGGSVAFAHIDCDLHSSTRTVFEHLGERMGPGTVLVFDEYLGYPDWRAHEFGAFQDHVRAARRRYEYVAFNVFGKQAAVRLI